MGRKIIEEPKYIFDVTLSKEEYEVLDGIAKRLGIPLKTTVRIILVNVINSGDLKKYIKYPGD